MAISELKAQNRTSTQVAAGFCCHVGISPVNHAVPQGHLYVLGPCVAGVPSGHALIEKFNKVFTIKRPNDFLFLFHQNVNIKNGGQLHFSPSSIEVSDWLNLSHVMPSNDRPAASQSDVAEILSKRFHFKCDLQKGARSLKMLF